MADPQSRARLERLLRGEFRPDDLTRLFLFARDHCDGRESVADVGHFIAHHMERDRGIIARSTREWFVSARYHMARFGPAGPYPLHGEKMPRAARDYFKIAVHRIDPKTITEKTGLRRVAAQDIMSKLADRLAENADGSWALPENLSKQEIKLVECVSSHFVVKPAFGADRLFDDFVATLKSNGLITKDELSQNRDRLRALAQLFAVSVMHNCVIDIGDGTTTQLKARPEPGERQIRVNASVPVEQTPGLFVAASMFSADVDPALHCDPGLAVNQDWNFEIELSFDGRLTALR